MSFAISAAPFAGKQLRSFECFNFSGGLDLKTAPTKLALLGARNKWLTKATNVVYNDDGSVSKRWGMVLAQEDSETQLDNNIVLGGYEFRTSDGTSRNVVATKTGSVYRLGSNGLFTTLKTGLTNTTDAYSFATYNDLLHVANGVDAPQKWDGTTWAALGGSSPATASVFVAHGNRVFALDKTTASLYWCKLNVSTDWSGATNAGSMDVNPNDGSSLHALVSSIQELVLLKRTRPYRLQGIGPATGYTVADNLVPSVGSAGTVSKRGAVFAGNTVYYVSDIGVHTLSATQQFGDITEGFISDRIQPYFQSANVAISPVSPLQDIGTAHVATRRFIHYDPAENWILVAGRIASSPTTYPDTLLVYDIGASNWAVWTLPTHAEVTAIWSIAGGVTSVAPAGLLNIALHSTSTDDSGVMTMYRGLTGFVDVGDDMASTAISAQLRHVTHLGVPNVQKIARHIYLYFSKESSTTTMTLNLYADFQTTAAFTTTFDITSTVSETQVIKRIDLPGIHCEYLEVDLQQATAGKTFTFYGYEVQWQAGRTVRRAE